jgi:hypothetical protein
VLNNIPLPDNSTVTQYSDMGDCHYIAVNSPEDALQTCKMMIVGLGQRGYDSGDNPSRILEGVEFNNQRARFPRLYVKVGISGGDQCTIEIRAYEN